MGTVAVLLPVALELLKAAPGWVSTGRDVVQNVKDLWDNVTSEEPATPEQQAQFDEAYQQVHQAIQDATTDVAGEGEQS